MEKGLCKQDMENKEDSLFHRRVLPPSCHTFWQPSPTPDFNGKVPEREKNLIVFQGPREGRACCGAGSLAAGAGPWKGVDGTAGRQHGHGKSSTGRNGDRGDPDARMATGLLEQRFLALQLEF